MVIRRDADCAPPSLNTEARGGSGHCRARADDSASNWPERPPKLLKPIFTGPRTIGTEAFCFRTKKTDLCSELPATPITAAPSSTIVRRRVTVGRNDGNYWCGNDSDRR